MPIVLTDAKEPDKSHTKSSPFLAGDLIIRDLGYFSIAAFAEMLACGASFLSRMHGGVGMTDEFDVGLFMKRVRVLNELFGDAGFHSERLARAQGF